MPEAFKNFIAGEWVAPSTGEYFDNRNPADWNVSETARTLQMPRSNLYKKIERYGLAREGGA